LRLALGEPHLSLALNRRLGGENAALPPGAEERRTVGQLLTAAEEESERVRQQRAAQAEAKRIAELEALAQRESQAWRDVDALIQEGKAKSYEEAVQLLLKLNDLAEYHHQSAAFQERLNQIYHEYSRRSALLRRLRAAGLTET